MLKDMQDERRAKLMEAGADILADGLLELAVRYKGVNDYVNRIIAGPEEKLANFKKKVEALKKMTRFYDYRESNEFENEVSDILQELKAGNPEPRLGLELVISFFETDFKVIEGCDSDSVSMVYTEEAANLFAEYAKKCTDKEFVMDRLCSLLENDNYCVRMDVLKRAGKFLGKIELRKLFERMQEAISKSAENYCSGSNLLELARQLKDIELFIRLATNPQTGIVYPRFIREVAELYYDCRKYEDALAWMNKFPDEIPADFRGRIYRKLNLDDKIKELCWELFLDYPSLDSLNELLLQIGKDQKDKVIEGAIKRIFAEDDFESHGLEFLIEIGDLEAASRYVIINKDRISGGDYYSLPQLVEPLKQGGFYLAATIILRALLNSLLERKASKAYHYGADYWYELAELASLGITWQDIAPHESYIEQIKTTHRNKYAFWGEVERKNHG